MNAEEPGTWNGVIPTIKGIEQYLFNNFQMV